MVIACKTCNNAKGNRQDDWLAWIRQSRRPLDRIRVERFPHAMAQLKQPLRDAAMMNATRWRLYRQLSATGLPVEGGTGGRTTMQRLTHRFPKEH